MIKARASQFKLVLVFTLGLALAIAAYISWALVNFNVNKAYEASVFLSEYSERTLARYRANPAIFEAADDAALFKLLGSERANAVLSHEKLKSRFPFIPQAGAFKDRQFKAIMSQYRGVFKVPDFLLVLPTRVAEGKVLYSYVDVDERINGAALNLQILEQIQPAIYVALMCIFLLVVVELFHINKINANISDFAGWANQLSAGVRSPPVPAFSSSKYNYMAFAIDKSLSGISDMLEKEQSFAKFTSHELRTPIAVLSANLELLELIMQDLSPPERAVLRNMESAVSDMKYQMEALLWLSREGEVDFEYVRCSMHEMMKKALHDNAYLIAEKMISIELSAENAVIESNSVFLQIIFNNLVRNAFQYTESGTITITLNAHSAMIENREHASVASAPKRLGFGIGLVLVDKMVSKLGAHCQTDDLPNGRRVSLTFAAAQGGT